MTSTVLGAAYQSHDCCCCRPSLLCPLSSEVAGSEKPANNLVRATGLRPESRAFLLYSSPWKTGYHHNHAPMFQSLKRWHWWVPTNLLEKVSLSPSSVLNVPSSHLPVPWAWNRREPPGKVKVHRAESQGRQLRMARTGAVASHCPQPHLQHVTQARAQVTLMMPPVS